MQSVAFEIGKLIDKVLVKRGICPVCNEPLYSWRTKNPDGSDRCAPTCMRCGYFDLKRKEDQQTARIYNESLKAQAISFFKNGSVVSNKSLFECSLRNFNVVDQETKIALETAKRYVTAVLLGKPAHLVLSGKAGVGKSHLAMSIAWEVLKRSNYAKKILFISYQEMLEQIRFSYNNQELRRMIEGSLIADIKTANLVIIDDVGAELGKSAGTSREFGASTLNSFLEARQDRATVVTTNLSSKELSESYGSRIVSRLYSHSDGFSIKMNRTADKRVQGIRG